MRWTINAAGHQVNRHARTFTISDPAQLKTLIGKEKPHLAVPEIEAIATSMLEELEAAGVVHVTMDHEGIRRVAAETLGLTTSPHVFRDSLADLQPAIDSEIDYPQKRKGISRS